MITARIAFVVGDLSFGGATTFLLNLASGLTRQGIPIQIHCLEKGNAYRAEFAKLGDCVFSQDEERLIFEDRMAAVCRKLADFQPTAVVGWLGSSSYEILRYVPTKVTRLAVIHCDHPIFYKALLPYIPYMDGVIAYSGAMKRKLSEMPEFKTIPVHYLPNGVPIPSAPPLPRDPSHFPLRILYMGRLDNEQKRVRLFPEILAELVESKIPFRWTIVGQGPERAFLQDHLRTESPDQQVVIAESASYDEIPGILAQQDILLLASHSEGLPLSLLEAMGRGVVPVISDIESGVRDVVDASNGLLVPIDDTKGYARAIIWLHEHRDALKEMRQAAHARVLAEHSVEAMAREWLNHLQKENPEKISWPHTFRVSAPKEMETLLQFQPVFRPLRRLYKKIACCRKRAR